jgi:hypothetical protein
MEEERRKKDSLDDCLYVNEVELACMTMMDT